jgi:type II secretory pathway pseudopilin PulG
MKTARKTRAFTIVELLLSVAILAMLMAAVAVAFDASVKNYQANESIYQTVKTGRQAMMRMISDLRSARAVNAAGTVAAAADTQYGVIAAARGLAWTGDDANSCKLITAAGLAYCYRYDPGTKILHLDDNDNNVSYVLCRNVKSISFVRSYLPGTGTDPDRVQSVRITLSVSGDDVTEDLAAATVVRKNLF